MNVSKRIHIQLKISFILGVYVISCYQYNFCEALVGTNVKKAKKKDFPFIVSLMNVDANDYSEPENDHICTGALVTRSHVLTASHCFENRLRNQTVVILGHINIFNGKLFRISWWISFVEWGEYTGTHIRFQVNDIGVTKINGRVSSKINLGVLSPLSNQEIYGGQAILVGWGKGNDGFTSPDLLKGAVEILTNDECISRVQNLQGSRVPIHDRLICSAASPYLLMHHGDSGGPLLCMNMIVGVGKATIPFPNVPVHPDKINVHTGIDYYRDFVQSVISENFQWF